MRVVCDTNVLICGLLIGGPSRDLVQHVLVGSLTNVSTAELLAEFAGALRRPKFAASPEEVAVIVNQLSDCFEFVVPGRPVAGESRDPDDDRVLKAALAGNVDVILTGDLDLLELREFEGVAIVKPAEMLQRLTPAG